MEIRKKLYLIILASILATAVPGGALMYAYTERHMLQAASADLDESTHWFANTVGQKLLQGEPKLRALAQMIEQALSVPIAADELLAFAKTAERNPDGVWRNRRAGFDGTKQSGVFLPDTGGLTDWQKVQHLRIKRQMDDLGAATNRPGENLWYLSPQRSEIIFDRAYPNFAFEQKAENDYTQTPWVTLTSPTVNPQRSFGLTPPLYDPVPGVWMVSAVLPLYAHGQWIGSLGEDLPLSSAFRSLDLASARYPGTQHFLRDQSGNFVLAGAWQQQLEAGTVASAPDFSHEPELARLLQTPLGPVPRTLDDQLVVQGKRYLATSMQLEAFGWTYVKLTPVDEIMAPTRRLFLARTLLVGALLAIGGSLIGYAVGGRITRRIRALRDIMLGYAHDNSLRATQTLAGDDEIGEVARAYNALADEVALNIEQRKQAQAKLAGNEELWRFALEGAGYGVWDWNIADDTATFSPRSQDMMDVPPVIKGGVRSFWKDKIHPDDVEGSMSAMREHLGGLTPAYAGEYRVRCQNGQYKWVLNRGRVVTRDVQGQPLRVIGTHTDISPRKGTEARLAESSALLHTLLYAIPDLVWLKDVRGRYLACNHRFEQFFGAAEQQIVGKTDYDFIGKAQADFFRTNDQKAMDEGGLHRNEEWISFAADGHRELLETTKLPVRGPTGQLVGVLGIGHDVTAHRLSQEKLKLAASVFTHAREAIMITSADGSIVDVNDAFVRITGYGKDDVLGLNPRILSSGRQSPDFYTNLWQCLIGQGYWYGEVWNRRKNGEVYAEMQTISAVHDSAGNVEHYVSLFSDITATKEHQRQLEHIAHFDALTQLPNRVLLGDRLQQALAQSQRRGTVVAVVYLDLDGFKAINDSHGHSAGDLLLVGLADHMKQSLREGDTLARIGGDEFVAVLTDLPNVAACEPLLTRLLAAAAQPVAMGSQTVQVSASLGVTFYPQAEEVDADQLLRQADQAMYLAKSTGKNRYHCFNPDHDGT